MPDPAPQLEGYIRVVRTTVDALGMTLEQAIASMVPPALQQDVLFFFDQEKNVEFKDAHMVEDHERTHVVWLPYADRANWYYWKRMRNYLIDQKGWSEAAVNSIDDATDKVLGAMEDPVGQRDFFARGLVVGYVQSGKTANYSALIAKAADAGYRLVVVLTGIHNNLRQQTQRRLAAELTGLSSEGAVGVGRPSPEKEWHTYTTDDLRHGDFNPGHGSTTALVGTNPILIVTKKNNSVLARLIAWLERSPKEVRDRLPCLVIDDEADQASPNTGGNRSPLDTRGEINELTDEDESPSSINAKIRVLLTKFRRVAYVAYTATPFANILIDPAAVDDQAGEDLYPRSFILSLPKPAGYYGADAIFGTGQDSNDGMDVIRPVPDDEASLLTPRRRDLPTWSPQVPDSLRQAMDDFVLAGSARAQRGDGGKPATMLIHPSQSTDVQVAITPLIADLVSELKYAWRYSRDKGMLDRLKQRWESDFRRVTRSEHVDLDVSFDSLQEHVGPFLEQVVVKQLNFGSDDELDYEKDKGLKVVVIGGNKLSRGLTLEGLLVSYYVRAAAAYDTLLQMGRWFGYRPRYADLTRIYTTAILETWFRDLAVVEQDLRTEIARYEIERRTPLELGVKIRTHSAMMVTSPLKMKAATAIRLSFEDDFIQTVTFPFEGDNDFFRHNLKATRSFLASLPAPESESGRFVWKGVSAERVTSFLTSYLTDADAKRVQTHPICSYIRRQNAYGELTEFVVTVMGLDKEDPNLGSENLGITSGARVNLIERTRLRTGQGNSIKALGSQPDQGIGLTDDQRSAAAQSGAKDGSGYRWQRNPKEGLLLIYPVSKYSGQTRVFADDSSRQELFTNPEEAEHVIGLALSFPHSDSGATVEYVTNPIGVTEE